MVSDRPLVVKCKIFETVTCELKLFRLLYQPMTKAELRRFTSWLGRRSYAVRVERLGIKRIREIARENGKKGGRPPGTSK